MARIRTIKPEFWSDEKLSLQDPVTRLVFLGLISNADDAGRLIDNVKQIDGMIFPNTVDTCRDSLATLARLGRIIRYTSASGQDLVQVTKWKEHQKVDKPAKYVLPGPTSAVVAQAVAAAKDAGDLAGESRDPREDLAGSSRSDLRPTTPDLRPVPGPTTSGDLSTNEGRPRKTPRPPFDLPDVVEFGRVFYGHASRDRIRDVKRQLRATLNGGAMLRRHRVTAGSPQRLAAKCREVIAEGVKDHDKAIVVLLTKLGDVGNADDSPTERAQREQQAEEIRDATDNARRLELAEAWLPTDPAAAAAVTAYVATLPEIGRSILRNAAVLKAWTDAGEPTVQPAGAP